MTTPAPDAATRRQIFAADPAQSTWLGANAGSGKTRVLTDRVARLLLAGTPPQNILCLTYTKAAASEMQNRLFKRLGAWAMESDADLRDALSHLGLAGPVDDAALNGARRLFAKAIETPGGLKIQTIHAFCAALLRQFPLEAGVSPNFTELDDRSAGALSDEVLEDLADGAAGARLSALARYLSDETLDKTLQTILKSRTEFAGPLDFAALIAAHDLPPGFDEATLLADVFDGSETAMFATMLPVLQAKGGNDAKVALKIAPVLGRLETLEGLIALEGFLLSGKDTKAGSYVAKIDAFPTKATRDKLGPAVIDPLNALMLRVEAARGRRVALASARRSLALHEFAAVFLPAMERRKAAQGLLDFDDLILRARQLLSRAESASWVLYKLDGRIDHILVDEAQDTSPAQWDVIRALSQELTAGSGARDDVMRTIFVVGDKKQSIYSFQGADPAAFDRLRGHFEAALSDAGAALQNTALEHSFRSSAAVLAAVDATFAPQDTTDGIGGAPTHVAHKTALPGRVDLWGWVEEDPKAQGDHPWQRPRDMISPKAAAARLAAAIAAELRRLIDTGETVPDGRGGREPLHEGHVLILVGRRKDLFREILRACKRQGLAVAGADRLQVTQDLAVRDLLALLAFLALPEDDLSLACALRSPIFGWTEDALYRLAQPRLGYLWQALRTTQRETETARMLFDLRDQSDFMRPYELLERVLTRHGARGRLVARLGPECEEAIDALLDEALNYERAHVPSLTGFLEWMRGDDIQIKRQTDSGGRQLRVMTVHGAKGQEAPLVILPDCGDWKPAKVKDVLIDGAGGPPFWTPIADETPDMLTGMRADSIERQMQERLRLLYVAMTRAESWLWVCAAGKRPAKGGTWHDRVEAGLRACGAADHASPTGPGLRLSHGHWGALPMATAPSTAPVPRAMPDWAAGNVPPTPAGQIRTIAASALGGAKALPGDVGLSDQAAKRRGTLLHLLLEHLPEYPPASWPALAPDLLAMAEDPAYAEEAADLLAEATGVLTAPGLRHAFAPGTLAEVELTCPLPGLLPPPHDRLVGIIDRLIVSGDHVLAIDYKSNATVPANAAATPEGLLRQMGAYQTALEAIYPAKKVETALLWTRDARLMPLPRALVMAALQRAASG